MKIKNLDNEKVSNEMYLILEKRMDTFSNLESIDKFQNEFFPKIEKFS